MTELERIVAGVRHWSKDNDVVVTHKMANEIADAILSQPPVTEDTTSAPTTPPDMREVVEALESIKTICVGEASANGWDYTWGITKNRSFIADQCDIALANLRARIDAAPPAPTTSVPDELRKAATAALDYLTDLYNKGEIEGHRSGLIMSDLHVALLVAPRPSGAEESPCATHFCVKCGAAWSPPHTESADPSTR
jgi:hypothetical protein